MFMRKFSLLLGCLVALTSGAAAQDGAPASAFLASGPSQGDRAPDFSLPWSTKDGVGNEQWFSLTAQRGKTVVLAFFPAAFTKGCTSEMQTFTERYDELFGPDVVVAAISYDSVETQARFASSLGVPFKLLSDPNLAVAKKYGSANSDGKARRTVYVIDKSGRVAYRDLRFNAVDPSSYSDLKQAVQAALKAK
jgi:peroxiredoxin Q/BCP